MRREPHRRRPRGDRPPEHRLQRAIEHEGVVDEPNAAPDMLGTVCEAGPTDQCRRRCRRRARARRGPAPRRAGTRSRRCPSGSPRSHRAASRHDCDVGIRRPEVADHRHRTAQPLRGRFGSAEAQAFRAAPCADDCGGGVDPGRGASAQQRESIGRGERRPVVLSFRDAIDSPIELHIAEITTVSRDRGPPRCLTPTCRV